MADTTTELEVLDEIVDVLGGQSGQYETVVPTLQQIRDLLGGGGGGGGYNPALSVGRADALTGADETAQWAQRESTGSGTAIVRSVQGATEVQDGELVPVRIAGIQIVGFNQWDCEWEVGSINNATGLDVASQSIARTVGYIPMLPNTDYYLYNATGNTFGFRFYDANKTYIGATTRNGLANSSQSLLLQVPAGTRYFRFINGTASTIDTSKVCLSIAGQLDGQCKPYMSDAIEWTAQTLRAAGSVADVLYADHVDVKVGERAYQSGDESDATVRTDGTTTFYALAEPTTTPISPALPMTYKVQVGGSESIIVPAGEISATPIITVAEGESAADVVMDALACIATPDGPVATANHALGTYLTMGGKLYKVTSAIAVGETITPNTNVSETTVMAELIARTA